MIIDYENVSVRLGERDILNDVTFQINEGDFVYLVGRVGSGKSTLLKTMYGEVDAYQGKAIVLDTDMRRIKRNHLPRLRRQLGIVFQDFQLLTDRNVNENLDFVLRATGWNNKKKREARISEVLSLVDMDNRGKDMPYILSGGEQQRICIARALLNSPSLILADEPTGNLDSETTWQTIALLYDIAKKGNTTVILTTHNEAIMDDFSGRVFNVKDGHITEEK